MNWSKYSGYLLCATGVLHNLIGVALGWSSLVAMHESGWWSSTVLNGELLFDRIAIVWFLSTGAFWIVLGLTLQKVLDQGFRLPPQLGWSFLAIGLVLIVIEPASGAYLLLIQGLLILLGNKSQTNSQTEVTQ